jgi:hypothetical protein
MELIIQILDVLSYNFEIRTERSELESAPRGIRSFCTQRLHFFHHRFRERIQLAVLIQSSGTAIMPTSREYRHRAEECLRLANGAQEIYARVALLELVGEFRALAQQLELRARRTRRQTNEQRFSSAAVYRAS